MGLACSNRSTPTDNYKITYHAPQPRAVIEVVKFDDYNQVVGYGETGRVKLYTMTKELSSPVSWNATKANAKSRTRSIPGTASAGRGRTMSSRRRRRWGCIERAFIASQR